MPEPVATTSESELRPLVERALTAAYELEREIGRGGMGIVYRAKDRRLKRHVAIKILPPELAFRSEIRSRFLREAETAAQLNHPHIVPIYSVDEAEGLVYFVMACVDGENLGKRLHDRGPLPIPDVRRILAEVADALAYAHARGVVHRDIKPDNILLDRDGDRALVTDFGIARAIIEGSDARLTATGMAIGTPAFMSPEQSAGDREIDGRSDLYSLGVVAYQMLAGELPFNATSTPAMLVKHLSERPVPVDQRRPDCPSDLAMAVMRLLEKEPRDRFGGADELEAVLLGTRSPVPSPSYATTQPPIPSHQAPLPPAPARGANGQPLPPAPAPRPVELGVRLPGFGLGVAVGEGDGDAARRRAAELAGLPGGAGEGGRLAAGRDGWNAPDADYQPPTADEIARWHTPRVENFRRKLGWYVIVNAVILVLAIVGSTNLLGLTGLWTVYLAFLYAQLWSDGFDWRDVLRQPKDRLFADVAAEGVDNVAALFDPERRARVRERARRERLRGQARPAVLPGAGTGAPLPTYDAAGAVGAYAPPADYGRRGDLVRQAVDDRDEILRLLGTMPKADRDRVPEVGPSAQALADKVQALAALVADLERSLTPEATEVVEREIARLEAEANPLDRAGSETRVKRLAHLKRQRRAVADVSRRRDVAAGKLEHCRLALQNMRLDLVRLRTGANSPLQVTTVAERAMALAREVDGIVGAAAEARAAAGGRPADAGRR